MILLLAFLAGHEVQGATSVAISPVKEMSSTGSVTVNGVVRSRDSVVLSAAANGELRFVIEEGAAVKSGVVVARVDSEELELRLQEQRLLTTRADINLKYLNAEAERMLRLDKANLTSKTQLAEIISRRDLARNDLAVSKSRAAQLEASIARTRITSPVDGVVVERMRQQGEFVRSGDPVIRVVNTHRLEVRASVPVSLFGRVDRTSSVHVVVSEVEFESRVRLAIGESEDSSQTFTVLIDVPGAVSNLIVPGQLTDVFLPLTDVGRELLVPRDAIVLRNGGNYVFRVDERNRAKRVDVSLGAGRGDRVAVSGDLEHGDRVVVRGAQRLEDGQEVVTTNETG